MAYLRLLARVWPQDWLTFFTSFRLFLLPFLFPHFRVFQLPEKKVLSYTHLLHTFFEFFKCLIPFLTMNSKHHARNKIHDYQCEFNYGIAIFLMVVVGDSCIDSLSCHGLPAACIISKALSGKKSKACMQCMVS